MQTETHFRKHQKSIVLCFTLWPHQVFAADISNLKGLSLESQLARMVPGHGHHLFSRICCKMPQASLEARGFTVASHWLQSLKMKTLLTWRKLLCRTCHRWRCLMMTRVSGRCKAMPRKFSLAPWLHQMTRQHFLKSRASIKDIIHCSIAIESHCRISSSILFLALFSIKLEHDLIADMWCRISAKVTPGAYGGSVYGCNVARKNERLGGDWQGSIRLFRGASSGPCYHSYCCKSTQGIICVICVLMFHRMGPVAPRISTMHCPKATYLQQCKTSFFWLCDATFYWCFVAL